jgi:hypothetical protein
VTARRVVVVLVFALAVYFGLIGYRGIYLIGQHSWTLRVFGVAVLIIPLIGVWVVVAEIRFGRATEQLAQTFSDDELALDPIRPELPRLPSGRIDRGAADELFEERRRVVEAAPERWQGWYRLAVAYDLAGDRRRAREAMRTAISRFEATPA